MVTRGTNSAAEAWRRAENRFRARTAGDIPLPWHGDHRGVLDAGAAENVAAAEGTAADNAVANGIIRAGEQAGAEGVVNAAPLATSAAENPLTGTALARQLGQEGERAADILKNTERVPSLTGTANYRIPDVLDRTGKLIGEVKNVDNLPYTSQLQDFAAYAKQNGYRFELTVRQGTQLSGPLQKAVNSGDIILKRALP